MSSARKYKIHVSSFLNTYILCKTRTVSANLDYFSYLQDKLNENKINGFFVFVKFSALP